MENVRKHRDIRLVTTERRKIYLVSKPNYHTTKFFAENFSATEMKKTELNMNKPAYLGLSILRISKTVMHEFWYNYLRLKYDENAKLCYMDTGSFIVFVKTHDIYKDIAEDVKTRSDTSNYEIDRLLSIGKKWKSDWINEKLIRWTIYGKICWINSRSVKLFKRQ